jgi:S-formylglutathione hydrolase FrmB
MKTFRYTASLGLAMLIVSAQVCAGEVVGDKVESAALGASLPFTVYLPDGYHDSFDKFPVVYLLHGSGGDEHVWTANAGARETLDGLIRRRIIKPVIAVMPAGGSSWWIDGTSQKMQTALVKDLMPYIEKQYEAGADRTQRAVVGLSMGGFGALNLALTHPDAVCAAGLLSPAASSEPPPDSSARSHTGQFAANGKFDLALWQQKSYPALLAAYSQKKTPVPFFIHSGDHDQMAPPTMMTDLYTALYKIQPKQVELRIEDGDHEWMTFRDSLPQALRFIQQQCAFQSSDNPQ